MTALTDDLARRSTARSRVLAALIVAGPRGCRNVDLALPSIGGLRAMGRVHELQREGHDITVTREQGGVWRVILHGTAPVVPAVDLAAVEQGRLWT